MSEPAVKMNILLTLIDLFYLAFNSFLKPRLKRNCNFGRYPEVYLALEGIGIPVGIGKRAGKGQD